MNLLKFLKRKRINPVPRVNSFVVFDQTTCNKEIYDKYFANVFGNNKLFIFLGEIPNARGHCILVDLTTGKIIGIYHTSNFREANENEV